MPPIDKKNDKNYNDRMKFVSLNSEKTEEILKMQEPMDLERLRRIKEGLARQDIVVEQSDEWDRYLVSKGAEALTFSDRSIVMHTKVSASGCFEELIHYGQIKSGRAIDVNAESNNNVLMEIEAKERLIKYKDSYGITDYEVDILTDSLNWYKILLDNK